eukprot:8911039-Pyramimonas_sp.AAC.1
MHEDLANVRGHRLRGGQRAWVGHALLLVDPTTALVAGQAHVASPAASLLGAEERPGFEEQ